MKNHTDSIKIALVEDDDTVRESLKVLLNGSTGFSCAGAYASAESALVEIDSNPPDIVLMDIHLPGIDGIECVVKLKERFESIQIMMLTVFEDSEEIFRSLAAGASDICSKRLLL